MHRCSDYSNGAFPGLVESQQESIKIDHITSDLSPDSRLTAERFENGCWLINQRVVSAPTTLLTRHEPSQPLMFEHSLFFFLKESLCCVSLMPRKATCIILSLRLWVKYSQILRHRNSRPGSFICIAHFISEVTSIGFTLKALKTSLKENS